MTTYTSNTFSVTVSSWQLPASNYVSTSITGMLPNIIAPRPDGELGTYSRYKWAYPGVRYEVPIAVQGGSYPFKFTITATSGTADTSGATIGETLTPSGDSYTRPDNYGVLEWTPAAGDDGNSFGFTIQVEDQDGNTDTVTFTGTVQASQFIFYDSTDTGSTQAGTIGEPYNDWHTAFGANDGSGLNGTKICYIRSGDHPTVKDSPTTAGRPVTEMRWNSEPYGSNRPTALINYPDESPEIDMSDAHIRTEGSDFFTCGINYHDNPTNESVGRFFFLYGSRVVFWRNTFTNYYIGTSPATDNPAALYSGNGVTQYYSIISNEIDGTAGTLVQWYDMVDSVVENNRALSTCTIRHTDASSHAWIWLKARPKRTTVRANDCSQATWNVVPGYFSYGCPAVVNYLDVEFCYNKGPLPAKSRGGMQFFSDQVGTDPTKDNMFVYRNSLGGGDGANYNHSIQCADDYYEPPFPYSTFYVGKNHCTSNFGPWLASNPTTTLDDNQMDQADSSFDSSMNLTGSARTNYLGTHGAEIA